MEAWHRLDSWKEISAYIKRTKRTCRHWETKFGLPVYRIDRTSTRSRVFAFQEEIDFWFTSKTGSLKEVS